MKRLIYISIVVLSAALSTSAAQAQWVQTNGPPGGWVYCITTLGNDIFIGTQKGVFELTDSGTQWVSKSNGLLTSYIYCMTTHGSNLFAGVYQNGIYRSTDSGATWSSVSTGLPYSLTVRSLGSDGHTLFIPDGSNSYISSNDGDSWTLLDTALTKFSNPDAVASIDSTTYLAGNWITKTTDEGLRWNVISVSNGNNTWNVVGMASIGTTLFVIDRITGVMRSTDSGSTWNASTPPISASSITCIKPAGTELFAGTNEGAVYNSTDSGTTWKLSGSGLPNGFEITSLASDNNILFAGCYALGMFLSFDSGNTWSESSQGLYNCSVNAIVTTGDTILAGGNSGLFISTNNGNGWEWEIDQHLLSNYNIQSLLIDDTTFFAGTDGGRNAPSLFSSTDRGETWIADTLINGYNFNALIRSGPNLVAGGSPYNFNSGFFKSSNEGAVWTSGIVNVDTEIVVLGIAKYESEMIAATNIGPFTSDNNGNSWSLVNEFETQNGTSYKDAAGIQCVGQQGTRFWLCTNGYYPRYRGTIFFTDDNGMTWHPIADTSVPPSGMATGFLTFGSALFVATDSSGVFLSTDSGKSWTSENLGLGDSNVISLAVQGNELLAGTATSGVWRRPLAQMIPASSVANEKQIPDTISVYPDPASSMVTISCQDIVGSTEVSLISETGATVWHRTITTNGQPFQLDLAGVANGAYRLELRAGNVSQASKIVLQR